jgi:peptide/nickel transport system ATP-binding protein
VRKVNFELDRGESLGLVGESGCGKSTLAYAVVNYLGRTGLRLRGRVLYQGRDIASLSSEALRALRGQEIAMVYQDPMSSLNPVLTIGEQLMEVPRVHENAGADEARQRAVEILGEVHLPDPESVMARYPHQLSGGQQQRVVIGMALMGKPQLLVMDEPTTGLDVTIEAAILELIAELRQRRQMAMLFISHNLGTVMRVCDRLGVMYSGELVEEGGILEVFNAPSHPYTRGLLECLPTIDTGKNSVTLKPIPGQVPPVASDSPGCVFSPRCAHSQDGLCTEGELPFAPLPGHPGHRTRCVRQEEIPAWVPPKTPAAGEEPAPAESEPLLRIEQLHKIYDAGGGQFFAKAGSGIHALNGISFSAAKGQTVAVVGESGCGKSTLAKVVTGLEAGSNGSIRFQDVELANASVEERPLEIKRAVQMVFQHPDGTLNPSHTVGFTIARTLRQLASIPAGEMKRAVEKLLQKVNLPAQYSKRLPRQLSGGQKQRVAIARALAGNPELVVADEPVSSLDVSVQAAILNLLLSIQKNSNTTLIFISHDLAVVRFLADHVCVMYLGRIMEFGRVEDVFAPPYHPYTEALLSAAPVPDPGAGQRRIVLEGNLPNPAEAPRGCPFQTRCPRKLGTLCEEEIPPEHKLESGHRIACHIPLPELQAVEPVLAQTNRGAGD